jgi:hypothetical protein
MFDGDHQRRFPIRFLGIWDTVSSVGWVWDPATFPYSTENSSIQTIRHAISLDERRCFFRQNRMKPDPESQDLLQLWFPGYHCDVGGGYDNKSKSWQNAFDWMIAEAKSAGLLMDSSRTAILEKEDPPSPTPWLEVLQESLKGLWWLLEIFPKWAYDFHTKSEYIRFGLGRPRILLEGEKLHDSVLKRIRDKTDYRPRNLSEEFIKGVLELKVVPPMLEYWKSGPKPVV